MPPQFFSNPFFFHLINILQKVFNGSKLLYKFYSGLFAYAFYTGYVIRGVSCKTHDFYNAVGCCAKSLCHLFYAKPLALHCVNNSCILINKLQHILVSRDDYYLYILFLHVFGGSETFGREVAWRLRDAR